MTDDPEQTEAIETGGAADTADDTEPASDDSEPASDDSEPASDDSEPASGDSEPASGDSEPESGDSEPASDGSGLAADDSEPAPDASEDFEALVARQKKQRMLRLGVALGLLAAAVGGIAIWVATRPDPRCTDPEEVDFFVNDRQLPAAAVGKVCSFPKPLDEALDAAMAAPPGYGGLLVSKAITDEPTLLTNVCAGGIDGLVAAGAAAPNRKVSVFLEHCELSGTEISESSARSSDLHLVVLAVAVYGALEDSDGADAGRLANRVLAGP